MNSEKKEYALIEYSLEDDSKKRAKYNKLKRKLAKNHISQVRIAAAAAGPNIEFVSREAIIPPESDYSRSSAIVPNTKIRAPLQEIKHAVDEYDQCEKQEAAIKEYIECLASLKKEMIAILSNHETRAEIVQEEKNTAEILEKLREALKIKERLDEEMAKMYSELMEIPP